MSTSDMERETYVQEDQENNMKNNKFKIFSHYDIHLGVQLILQDTSNLAEILMHLHNVEHLNIF